MSDTKISEFPEKALSSLDAAGTADFVGGYDVVSNNKTNKKFTFATLANWLLTKFKLTIAGSSQTVKAAIDSLNSKTNVTFTPETGVSTIENNLMRVGNVVVGNLWIDITSTDKLSRSSVLGTLSVYSLGMFRTNANIVNPTRSERGSFRINNNTNILVVDNNYAIPAIGAYNMTLCFCVKD